MFFFPYSTDAPIYHLPITTVIMIIVNVLVFALEANDPEAAWIAQYMLSHGDGLHPMQWLTANFLHAGLFHLLGNMFALWTFGLVVEGKLGWWKTLIAFLGIGVVQNALVQFFMLGSATQGASLGASSIVFGFMAMALIWAPANDIHCLFIFGVRMHFVEFSVLSLVGFYLALELTIVSCTQMAMSTALLHVAGATVGFPVGVALLKWNVVDCEDWDLFSYLAGRHGRSVAERELEETQTPEFQQQLREREHAKRAGALAQIRAATRQNEAALALARHRRATTEFRNWELPEADLLTLVQALLGKKLWADSIPLMVDYLAHYREKATPVRLMLAQLLLTVEKRPAQALKVLEKINNATLDAKQRALFAKLHALAGQLQAEDAYEIVEDW